MSMKDLKTKDVLQLLLEVFPKEIQESEPAKHEEVESKSLGWFEARDLPDPMDLHEAFMAKEVAGMLSGRPPAEPDLAWLMGIQFGWFLKEESLRRKEEQA